ncbi:MAG: hypothetical protein KAH22_08760 [Thiotrichaceae bacterium]|nr:hypothetical protein [Thiotrichaceae bacterium]
MVQKSKLKIHYGFIYVVSGFIGLILHSGLNPGELLNSIRTEHSTAGTNTVNAVKTDINHVVE